MQRLVGRTPAAATDAATKAYVDAAVRGHSIGPWSAGNFVATNSSTAPTICSLTIPAQTAPWRPICYGNFEGRSGGGTVLSIRAILGTATTGTVLARATNVDGTNYARLVMVPNYEYTAYDPVSNPAPGIVAAGTAQIITVFQMYDYGTAADVTTYHASFAVWAQFV